MCRFNAPNLLYINQGDGHVQGNGPRLRARRERIRASWPPFCDYDRDGWLDVYIATNILDSATHLQGQRGYLFHNNGDGTFTNVTVRLENVDETQSHSATWWGLRQ